MSTGDVAVENPQNINEGNRKGLPCTFYGCKRVYPDADDLQRHIKEHEIPAESLPGKTMMCSVTGCGGTFPNMQKLMEHSRHHQKPNIYFLCESCHAKLRSYRGLLVHLRSCAKAARPKQMLTPSSSAPVQTVPMEVDPVNTTAPPQDPLTSPPQLNPVLPPPGQPPLLPPDKDLAAPNVMPHVLDTTVNSLFSQSNPQPSTTSSPEVPPGPSTSEGQVQQTQNTPEFQGLPKFITQTLPASAWRPGQGPSPEKRVLWQHTRGRYTCSLCGLSVSNRKEMAEHSAAHGESVMPKEDPPNPAPASS